MVSAGLGVAWCVARVMYAMGYTTESKPNGSGRRLGTWFYVPELGEFVKPGFRLGSKGMLTVHLGLEICAGLTGWSLLSGQWLGY